MFDCVCVLLQPDYVTLQDQFCDVDHHICRGEALLLDCFQPVLVPLHNHASLFSLTEVGRQSWNIHYYRLHPIYPLCQSHQSLGPSAWALELSFPASAISVNLTDHAATPCLRSLEWTLTLTCIKLYMTYLYLLATVGLFHPNALVQPGTTWRLAASYCSCSDGLWYMVATAAVTGGSRCQTQRTLGRALLQICAGNRETYLLLGQATEYQIMR